MRAVCVVCNLKCVTARFLSTSANAAYQMSGHVLVMDASSGKMKDDVSGRTLPVYTYTSGVIPKASSALNYLALL